MDSQSDNVVVASPGGDGGLTAFLLAATQKGTKRTSEEITSKITLTKKSKLSIGAAEESLVVGPSGEEDQVITSSPTGPEDSQEEDPLTGTSTSSLQTSANNLAEEEGDLQDSASSVEVPDNINISDPQTEGDTLDRTVELPPSGEASEVGDYHGGNSGSSEGEEEEEERENFSDGDLEEKEESEEDYIIYSQNTSTTSEEDFFPGLNSPDTTGYSLGDIEL